MEEVIDPVVSAAPDAVGAVVELLQQTNGLLTTMNLVLYVLVGVLLGCTAVVVLAVMTR